jgi:hypothetical protein
MGSTFQVCVETRTPIRTALFGLAGQSLYVNLPASSSPLATCADVELVAEPPIGCQSCP